MDMPVYIQNIYSLVQHEEFSSLKKKEEAKRCYNKDIGCINVHIYL